MASAYRLPRAVFPRRYDIELTTSPERPDFSGKVSMSLDIRAETSVIELHARALSVKSAALVCDEVRVPVQVETQPEDQVVRFRSDVPLHLGPATLEVEYEGKLSASMHGLYLASDGGSRAVCSQCEATDARAIFPCFDEPEFKAELAWTLNTPKDLLALTNAPLVAREEHDDHACWRFGHTRPVSSYLAAVVVGPFDGTEPQVVHDVPLAVYAPRGKLDQTGFALDYTARLLPWYEAYFDIDYPFGKYDQVAVPGFDAGAMENVGLVLFRQNLLLMDPGTASWRQEKLIAKVIAHEFAHMWFGNLVTMKWWDDLWLNEAFAEWMAHKACDAISPDYRVWDDFQDDKNRALVDDALPTTHPIWTAVDTPDQAIEMFDVITYQKGCAVMRMLESFLGEAPFRDGLRAYMKAFAYGNAAGDDLWRALEEASGQPVGELMRSWIAVSGFPEVSIELSADGRELEVAQRRFLSSAATAGDPGDQTWNVPVVVRFEDEEGVKTHRFILGDAVQREPLPAVGKLRWLYPNAQEIGFYRSRLGARLAARMLSGGLDALDPIEQTGFVEDQWAFVRNGTGSIDAFLDVLEACARGPIENHNVLRAVVDRLGTVDRLLELAGDEAAHEGARAWIRGLLRAALDGLGLEPKAGEPQNDVQRRGLLLHGLARLGCDPEIVDAAVAMAERERDDPRSVDPNLAGTVLAVAAHFGDEARYEQWIAAYRARKAGGSAPQLSLRYLYTFAGFRPEALTRRTLAMIDDDTIPQEAVGPVLGQLLGHRHAQRQAWDFLQTRWTLLRARVGDMGISRVVEAVGALPGDCRADIVAFFEKNPPVGAERALARALESLDQREELRARITPALRARFGGPA